MRRLGLVVVMLLVGFSAMAAEMKLSIVDMQTVIDGTKEGKRIKDALNKEKAERDVTLESKRKDLKKLEDEFGQKQQVWTQSVREQKQKELQELYAEVQKYYLESGKNLEQKYANASKDIIKRIQSVIQKMATDRGYDFVLEKNQTQYFKTTYDITQDVIRLYDQAYK